MSDDKQLTVAELLAKSGKSEGSSSRSRRRRRAEDGGVSVAELTGSLRAVDKKPAESRHSSRPIDEENPDQPAAPAGHERAESPEPEAEQRPDEAAEREPAQAEPAELRDEPQAGAAEREAEPEAEEPAAPTPAGDEQTEADEPEDAAAPSEDETAVIPAVPADAEGAAGEAPEDEAQQEPAEEGAPAEEEPRVEDEPADRSPEDTETGVMPAVDAPAPERRRGQRPASPEADTDDKDDQPAGGPWGALLLTVAFVAVAVAVFFGFEQLWQTDLHNAIIASLGLVVSAGFVAVVHFLRTSRDGVAMLLAGVVGLAATFLPLVFV